MQYLMEIGAFKRSGKAGGRSTQYQANLCGKKNPQDAVVSTSRFL